MVIRQIMSSHVSRRDQLLYASSLRQRPPPSVPLGILEYNLSHNRLTDRFVEETHNIIRHDRWLKSLDLSHNLIETHGLDVLLDTLFESGSLISLDLRDNPGFTTLLSNHVLEFLLRNISALQETSSVWHPF